MVQRWIHVKFELESAWVNRVWAAYNRSPRELPPIPADVRELAIHVATRLNMLPRLAARLNEETAEIVKVVTTASPEHVSRPGKPGFALHVDNDLKFGFLLDVDSLFFELNALCEIMGLFVARIHELAGEPVRAGRVGATLKRVLTEQGVDARWFTDLDHARNLFSHSAAPYVAADVTDAAHPELLILTSNADEITDEDRIQMSEITFMVRGFGRAIQALEDYLVAFLGKVELPVAR